MTALALARLLVPLADGLWKLAKLVTWKTDASIYVVPYSSGRRYRIGQWRLEAHGEEQRIPVGDFPVFEGVEPKLSLHENGQAHVTFRGRKVAGPVQIPPLAELRGEHIAAVGPDDFSVLPTYDRPPKLAGREPDLVVGVDEGVTSGRIVLYANGVGRKLGRSLRGLADECSAVAPMRARSARRHGPGDQRRGGVPC